MKKIFLTILTALLTACGGGGGDATTAPAAPQQEAPKPAVAATQFIFWGNSLTFMPVDATYVPGKTDWAQGGWGMAASEPDKDYVHLVSKARGLPFVARNLADLERDPNTPLPSDVVTPTTIVVVQLGDNGLAAKYGDLMLKARAGYQVICLSSWGLNLRDRDAVMKPLCEGVGGTWVDISDIPLAPGTVSYYGHPGDTGMAEIARRVLAVAKK